MTASVEWIANEYRHRRNERGALIAQMEEAAHHFNGDVVIPLPELDNDEKPVVANLMAQGLDQTAMRVASVLPSIEAPPLVPGRDKGPGSEDYARRRRLAWSGWWQQSHLPIRLRRLARWLIGYSTGPMLVRPDFDTGMPVYELRNPLATFPSLGADYDYSQPVDSIYSYLVDFAWVKRHYPDIASQIVSLYKRTPDATALVELLEYVSAEERVMVLLTVRPTFEQRQWYPRSATDWEHAAGFEVRRAVNRAGVPWCVQSDRLTIDRMQGQFDQVFGIYQGQATLMALETIAVKKAIFPDLVLEGRTPGRTPKLINGKWRDGRTGDINVVRDGSVNAIQLNPGFMTQPLIDRHERNIRSQGGVPAQFSGETPANIATGRLGNSTLSATVDFPIQEYQLVIADMLQQGNEIAAQIARTYFGKQEKSFHVNFNRVAGMADYIPEKHFETATNFVRYSAPGADLNSLVVGIGQRVGIGTMSRHTAVHQDPMIPDPEFEYRKITSERIQQALEEFVAGAVASGGMDPMDVVILWEQVEKGVNIADAWRKAQEAAQKRQQEQQEEAAAAAQQQEDADPAALQPGLSPPGAGGGAEAGLSIQGPNPNQQNLAMLLGSLRQPSPNTAPLAGQGTPPQLPVG